MSHDDPMNDMQKSAQIADFKKIQSIYNKGSNEMPDSDIDKQILAAAHRNLTENKIKSKLKRSFWLRFALPLNIAAVVTVSALGIHWFWPQPVRVLPGTAPATVKSIKSDRQDLNEQKRGLGSNNETERGVLDPIHQSQQMNKIHQSQEKWIENIIHLLDKGDKQAANASIAAFKAQYPNYPLDNKIAQALKGE